MTVLPVRLPKIQKPRNRKHYKSRSPKDRRNSNYSDGQCWGSGVIGIEFLTRTNIITNI